MRVFVTGATGFIGSAVVQDLLAAGHRVLGLARNGAAAATLAALGVEAHPGDVTDPTSLALGAAACDGVIHTAFIHDFAHFKANCETDRRAVAAMGTALAGSARPLVVTSGNALLAHRPASASAPSSALPLATEDQVASADAADVPRIASEEAAAEALAAGANVSVVRLPPSVHGDGDHGFVPLLIGIARSKGVAACVGEGLNRWPAVHRLDAAALFRRALERARPGARYHGNAEQGVPFCEIAGVIGRQLGLPVVGLAPDEVAAHFGWFAHFAALDNPTSSAQTQAQLGWRPVQPGLLADLDRAAYFAG